MFLAKLPIPLWGTKESIVSLKWGCKLGVLLLLGVGYIGHVGVPEAQAQRFQGALHYDKMSWNTSGGGNIVFSIIPIPSRSDEPHSFHITVEEHRYNKLQGISFPLTYRAGVPYVRTFVAFYSGLPAKEPNSKPNISPNMTGSWTKVFMYKGKKASQLTDYSVKKLRPLVQWIESQISHP